MGPWFGLVVFPPVSRRLCSSCFRMVGRMGWNSRSGCDSCRYDRAAGENESLLYLAFVCGVGDLRKTSGKSAGSSGRMGASRSDSIMCGVPVL